MRTLLTDPCFNVKSVEFLLNLCDDDGNEVGASVGPRGPTIPYTRSKEKKFVSLEEYEEVMDDEINQLRDVIRYIRREKTNRSAAAEEPMDEDSLCTICYANPVSVVFQPCNHTSCRTCIKQQLMSSKECFYCKTIVESYENLSPAANNSAGKLPLDGYGPSTSGK